MYIIGSLGLNKYLKDFFVKDSHVTHELTSTKKDAKTFDSLSNAQDTLDMLTFECRILGFSVIELGSDNYAV